MTGDTERIQLLEQEVFLLRAGMRELQELMRALMEANAIRAAKKGAKAA